MAIAVSLYHLIVPKDGLYVRLIVATWCNVWIHARGMYNAAIKYEIIGYTFHRKSMI